MDTDRLKARMMLLSSQRQMRKLKRATRKEKKQVHLNHADHHLPSPSNRKLDQAVAAVQVHSEDAVAAPTAVVAGAAEEVVAIMAQVHMVSRL
jgi:hypothetical protein